VSISYSTRPEGEDVGPRIRILPLELLGRHVLECAENRSMTGQFGGCRGERGETGRLRRGGADLRQPEIEELRLQRPRRACARPGQDDVGRFQISMDDACSVRPGQSSRDLNGNANRLLDRQRTLLETRGEGVAFQVFEDEKIGVAVAPEIVQGTDIRMIERGHRSRLALEAFAQSWVARHACTEDLDGDNSIESRVHGAIDLAHSASSER
jgi:hypothetical protein